MVKICGMTDERAVQAAVDAGADALGFVFFDKSPRSLSPERAVRLAAKVPQHVRRVAVMLHPDARLWDEVSRVLRPDVLQTDAGDFLYLSVVLKNGRFSVKVRFRSIFQRHSFMRGRRVARVRPLIGKLQLKLPARVK